MAEKTGIAWTDHTFNIAWGCTKVSPGCKHCYAEGMTMRFGKNAWGPNGRRRTFGARHWAEPLAWNRKAHRDGVRRRVFCSSMCDNFEDHPTIEAERAKLWPLIRDTPWLDWQLLTKRPERMIDNLPDDWGDGYPNVWLGVSIESNEYAHRADVLRQVPCVVRFVSYEPALGPLDKLDLRGLSWLIYGGESGPHYRKHDPAWPRAMRDRCRSAGVAFFHKQSPGRYPGTGVALDGEVIHEFPAPHRPQAAQLQLGI